MIKSPNLQYLQKKMENSFEEYKFKQFKDKKCS